MPSTGTPSSKTSAGIVGVTSLKVAPEITDSGPPDRITPAGPKARMSAGSASQGRISL